MQTSTADDHNLAFYRVVDGALGSLAGALRAPVLA